MQHPFRFTHVARRLCWFHLLLCKAINVSCIPHDLIGYKLELVRSSLYPGDGEMIIPLFHVSASRSAYSARPLPAHGSGQRQAFPLRSLPGKPSLLHGVCLDSIFSLLAAIAAQRQFPLRRTSPIKCDAYPRSCVSSNRPDLRCGTAVCHFLCLKPPAVQ